MEIGQGFEIACTFYFSIKRVSVCCISNDLVTSAESFKQHWNQVPFHFKPYFYVLETFHTSCLRRLLHVEELKLSPGWNFIPGWNFFRLHEHTNTREKQEYFNPAWNQKHHLHCIYTTWFINEDHCSKSYQLVICLTFTIVITKFWGVFEVLKIKRQKYMGKIVLALSSALTTCLLLL